MAVLQWGHHRSRTTSSDKKQHTTLDWFSRSTAEPSRQALAELMKEHSRSLSDDSTTRSLKGKSRPSTGASHHSHHCSARSDHSDHPSRPVSPSRSIRSVLDQPEGSNRSLLSRAGALKKKSSRMSLSSDNVSTTGVVSPPRLSSSRMGFRKRENIPLPAKSDSPIMAISKPFDFHHVSHTDPDQVTNLGRLDRSGSSPKVNNTRTQLQPNTKTDTAPVISDIVPLSPLFEIPYRPSSPVLQQVTEPPVTPPKTTPASKEISNTLIPSPIADIRPTRSAENFSRPTPRSPVAVGGGLPLRSFVSQRSQTPDLITEVLVDSYSIPSTGPLPLSLPVIHAVSTQDDTARCMINAPLPLTPAIHETDHRPQHKRQTSSKGSLRHMSTFPSSRNPRPDVILPTHPLREIQEEAGVMSRYHSDDALSRPLSRSGSISSHLMLPMDDWEDAIDDAWDHQDEVGYSTGDIEFWSRRSNSEHAKLQEDCLVVHQQVHEQISSPSTPLMMMHPMKVGDYRQTLPVALSASDNKQSPTRANFPPTTGSRVDPKTSPKAAKFARTSTLDASISEQAVFDSLQYPSHSAYSALSKSSSQESIILSIASSIMGTHRSSNSSVNPIDYSHLDTVKESTDSGPDVSASRLQVETSKAARPESTCVPASLLQGFLASEYAQIESDPDHTAATKLDQIEREDDDVGPLPPNGRRDKTVSGSSIPVPLRISSITPNNTKISRRRASTISTTRRAARASYSLFPTTAAQPANASRA